MQQSVRIHSICTMSVFIIAMGIAAGNGRAAEGTQSRSVSDPGPVVETEEVVISATKTPIPVIQVTSSVEVITGEDLQRRGIKTVVDALRLGQGLAVFSTGGPGSQATVRIRGGSSSQTLVLIDGAIMNSGTNGQFNFANLTTDNIETIEILRGAQSMLWGSDAMGGVINITTKRGRGTPKASAFFEYGSFNSIREGGDVSGQHGPLDFSAALSRRDVTGFSGINYRRGAIERDAHRNWQGSTRLGLALPREGRLEFNFRWLNGDIDLDRPGGQGADVFKAKSTARQFVYSGSYEQPLTEWWEQRLTLSRQTQNLKTQNGTFSRNVATGVVSPVFLVRGEPTDETDTAANRIEWQHNLQVADPLLLTLGYQFREQVGEGMGNFPFPTKIVSSHAGFAQAQGNLWDRLFATAGFRQDEFNTFGSATTWRATGGYLHRETGTKVRGSYATGFRAPTINELFFPGFGNPALKPEKSQSLDAGIEQSLFKDRLKISATYYWNRFRNLIQTIQSLAVCGEDPTRPGSGIAAFCPENIGLARTKGWESSFDAVLLRDQPFVKRLTAGGQYTYTSTRDLTTGRRLPRWPKHQASAVVSYQPIDPFLLNVEFRYVGSQFDDAANQRRVGSFPVFNMSAEYTINQYVQVYTRVENLLDEKYEEVRLFGTPVRSIYGGLRANVDLSLAKP